MRTHIENNCCTPVLLVRVLRALPSNGSTLLLVAYLLRACLPSRCLAMGICVTLYWYLLNLFLISQIRLRFTVMCRATAFRKRIAPYLIRTYIIHTKSSNIWWSRSVFCTFTGISVTLLSKISTCRRFHYVLKPPVEKNVDAHITFLHTDCRICNSKVFVTVPHISVYVCFYFSKGEY
jgi:hypothetical protein